MAFLSNSQTVDLFELTIFWFSLHSETNYDNELKLEGLIKNVEISAFFVCFFFRKTFTFKWALNWEPWRRELWESRVSWFTNIFQGEFFFFGITVSLYLSSFRSLFFQPGALSLFLSLLRIDFLLSKIHWMITICRLFPNGVEFLLSDAVEFYKDGKGITESRVSKYNLRGKKNCVWKSGWCNFVDGIVENRSMQNEKYLFVPISDPKD